MLDVTGELRPERSALLAVLHDLGDDDWRRPTECPAYDVQGIAAHLLGDDLSLLSRQRDGRTDGLAGVAEQLPGADFRTLLDAFNDRWVVAASFLSPALLTELLRWSGDRTADFYEGTDLAEPGEPVAVFGSAGEPSPYWQAIAREYLERWTHHSQIRRAVGLPSLADERFVRAGAAVAAAIGGLEVAVVDGGWSIGPILVGDTQQSADILTRAHPAAEVRALVSGPADLVDLFAAMTGRPPA